MTVKIAFEKDFRAYKIKIEGELWEELLEKIDELQYYTNEIEQLLMKRYHSSARK